ncbi:Eukaryotic translation initiation factor 3 subunit H, partial [Coemansia sp. RSA 1694]
ALVSELQWPGASAGSGMARGEMLALEVQRPSSFNAKLRARRMADRSAVADDMEGDESSSSSSQFAAGLLPTRPTAYLGRATSALDLDQAAGGSLARQLESIGELIDEHVHDANQWMYWKRGEAKVKNARAQFVQRRALSSAAREARGEAPEPEVDEKELDRMFRPLPEPSRLDALLNTANLNLLTKGITQSRGPALTKMFMAQGLHESSSSSSNLSN